mgnify:FL=1
MYLIRGGGTGASGTFTTPRLTSTATYTVTCTGANGTSIQTKAVSVAGSLVSFSSVAGGCVQDNVTGLMWEVKTTDGGLRDMNNIYTNYDSILSAQKHDFATNTNSNPTQVEIDASSNSIGFKAAVNLTNLCGFSDWRLPTVVELQSIVKTIPIHAIIDATWFPNAKADWYWTASPFVGFSATAWGTNFANGVVVSGQLRSGSKYIRLVRSGP